MVKINLEKKKDLAKQEKLRTRTLSDVLRAEVVGSPVVWPRYRADHPNRMDILDQLSSMSLVLVENNLCFLTFYGLVLLKTKEANKFLADCKKVFDALATHFKEHLTDWVGLRQIAERARLTPERVHSIVLLFQRRSPISISAVPIPLTIDSKLAANESLLRDSSFRALVNRTRVMLMKTAAGSMPSNVLGLFSSGQSGNLISTKLNELGSREVLDLWNKCTDRLGADPDGAITTAKSLIEGVCKQVLDGREVPYTNAADLPGLYRLVVKELELDPGKEANETLRKILSGCLNAVVGLAELRNIHGDSHGKAPGSGRPAQRHSHLAVALAGAFAAFLLETDEGRKRP
jgi:hypothetical protein